MEAIKQIEELLTTHGAVLIRQGKHRVYRLSNGSNFIMPNTGSDYRGDLNALSDLRRMLGVERRGAPVEEVEPTLQAVVHAPAPPKPAPLMERLHSLMEDQQWLYDYHMAEALKAEHVRNMLKAMLETMDSPEKVERAEAALRTVFPTAVVVAGPAPVAQPEPPPQVITNRMQVTRQIVWVAVQTFDVPFTSTELLTLMLGSRQVDSAEKLRIRQAILSCMRYLVDNGQVTLSEQGWGRKLSVFERVKAAPMPKTLLQEEGK